MNYRVDPYWREVEDAVFKDLISNQNWWRDGWGNVDIYYRVGDGKKLGAREPGGKKCWVNPEVFKPL